MSRPIIAFGLCLLIFSLSCGGVADATFCTSLKSQVKSGRWNGDSLIPAADILNCMHPTGTFQKAAVSTVVTSCQDRENWSLKQTVTIRWSGMMSSYKTGVTVEARSAGGYGSFKTTKDFDEALMPARADCTNGQWLQTQNKILDANQL